MRGEGETKLGMRKPSPAEGNSRGLLGSENRGMCANPMVLAPCVVQVEGNIASGLPMHNPGIEHGWEGLGRCWDAGLTEAWSIHRAQRSFGAMFSGSV